MEKEKKISKRHKAVIDEYFLNGFNGTKAYLSQYNVKKSSAATKFGQMVKRVDVMQYKALKEKENEKEVSIDNKRLIEILVSWIESDITQLMDLSMEEIKKLPQDVRRLITEFNRTTRYKGTGKDAEKIERFNLKFVSKAKAAEMLARHVGLFEKDNKQKGPVIENTINLGSGVKPK